MRHEVYREGHLAETELRTHRLRWYHRHEFAMMLDSVGFREAAVQCGYTDSDRANPVDFHCQTVSVQIRPVVGGPLDVAGGLQHDAG